jgi:hypothetical protein
VNHRGVCNEQLGCRPYGRPIDDLGYSNDHARRTLTRPSHDELAQLLGSASSQVPWEVHSFCALHVFMCVIALKDGSGPTHRYQVHVGVVHGLAPHISGQPAATSPDAPMTLKRRHAHTCISGEARLVAALLGAPFSRECAVSMTRIAICLIHDDSAPRLTWCWLSRVMIPTSRLPSFPRGVIYNCVVRVTCWLARGHTHAASRPHRSASL